MSNKPNEIWFEKSTPGKIEISDFLSVPIIKVDRQVFKDFANISFESNSKDAKILYSTDGGEPRFDWAKDKERVNAIMINESATIKAVSVNSKGEKSQIVESIVHKLPHDWSVKLFSTYNRQYTGGGEIGLIDGIRGTTNFASGEWQGYQSQDFIAVIDLQRETEIKKLGGGFLQVARSWIWMPTKIEFEISSDNVTYTKVTEIKTDVSPEDMESKIRDYSQSISPVKARYVRVKATNLGKIPAWHPGVGFDAFIFVDEIFIN
jgi:hypothetical protein